MYFLCMDVLFLIAYYIVQLLSRLNAITHKNCMIDYQNKENKEVNLTGNSLFKYLRDSFIKDLNKD